jgi:addiction module HigA family antidote
MKSSITPGEILLEEYLNPMGISQTAMARAIGVAPRAINEIDHVLPVPRGPRRKK